MEVRAWSCLPRTGAPGREAAAPPPVMDLVWRLAPHAGTGRPRLPRAQRVAQPKPQAGPVRMRCVVRGARCARGCTSAEIARRRSHPTNRRGELTAAQRPHHRRCALSERAERRSRSHPASSVLGLRSSRASVTPGSSEWCPLRRAGRDRRETSAASATHAHANPSWIHRVRA